MDIVAQWIVANPEGAAVLAGGLVTLLTQLIKKRFPAQFPAGSAQWTKLATSAVLSVAVTWAKAQLAGKGFEAMDAVITMAASTLAHSAVPGLRSKASKTPGGPGACDKCVVNGPPEKPLADGLQKG